MRTTNLELRELDIFQGKVFRLSRGATIFYLIKNGHDMATYELR